MTYYGLKINKQVCLGFSILFVSIYTFLFLRRAAILDVRWIQESNEFGSKSFDTAKQIKWEDQLNKNYYYGSVTENRFDDDIEQLDPNRSRWNDIVFKKSDDEYGHSNQFLGTRPQLNYSSIKYPNRNVRGTGTDLTAPENSKNLSNPFRNMKNDKFRFSLDLPRIFLHDINISLSTRMSKKTVCVFTRTARQDSLFKTNILSLFGSGQYNYMTVHSTNCQHTGTCATPEQGRKNRMCSSNKMPTVYLLERIKNFGHERFETVLGSGISTYDIMIVTGDEFCRATNIIDRVHFRTYAGSNVINSSKRTPVYLPLGPREEFQRVMPTKIRLVKDRPYVFNFIGSLTSSVRSEVVKIIQTKLHSFPHFLHVVQRWNKKLTKKNGYLPPHVYQSLLLDSIFTLCPAGRNPESFRAYEAIEAGSIPIVVLDYNYRAHECNGSFVPLIQQGAPFVFLNDWQELPKFLIDAATLPKRIQKMQADTMAWYGSFMRKTALQFEAGLEFRYRDRMETGKFTYSRSIDNVENQMEDPKYVKPLSNISHG